MEPRAQARWMDLRRIVDEDARHTIKGIHTHSLHEHAERFRSLVFHFKDYSAVWVEPGTTAYLILIGLNIETTFMFAIMGIVSTKMIPKDKDAKILGRIPNRIFIAIVMAALCVVVEVFLNLANALTWDYPRWNPSAPWLIFLVGYFSFWFVAFKVYDALDMKARAKIVGTILLVDLACVVLFMGTFFYFIKPNAFIAFLIFSWFSAVGKHMGGRIGPAGKPITDAMYFTGPGFVS